MARIDLEFGLEAGIGIGLGNSALARTEKNERKLRVSVVGWLGGC